MNQCVRNQAYHIVQNEQGKEFSLTFTAVIRRRACVENKPQHEGHEQLNGRKCTYRHSNIISQCGKIPLKFKKIA